MRPTIRSITACIILFSLLGCAGLDGGLPKISDDDRARLADSYLAQAAIHEKENELVAAKESYQLALAADPGNSKAVKSLQSVNAALQKQADIYYAKSQDMLKEGKYTRATRMLRMALRLWPGHEQAKNSLIFEEQIGFSDSIRHTVAKGETLSLISKLYYGTFEHALTIARINRIQDPARIEVGMHLKIPRLEHQPFVKTQIARPDSSLTAMASTEPGIPEVDAVQMYRSLGIEFFESGRYHNAIVEFNKVLKTDPGDSQSLSYIAKSYRLLGTQARYEEQYLTAIDYYGKALAIDQDCTVCRKELDDLLSTFKDTHYKAGMKYFDQEELTLAIKEWDMIYRIDPDFKQTAELLDKAKTIQKNINEIKKKQEDTSSE